VAPAAFGEAIAVIGGAGVASCMETGTSYAGGRVERVGREQAEKARGSRQSGREARGRWREMGGNNVGKNN